MIKSVLIVSVLVLVFLVLAISIYENIPFKTTGNAVSGDGEHSIGPSLEEQSCVKSCASQGCNTGDMECMKKNSVACLAKCNVQKPETTEETSCMEKCVLIGCSEMDFNCQGQNKEKCEKECNMIKAPDESEMSEEQKCISDCVNAESPGTICGASSTGETGNELCQRCANSCKHLYAGPCLDEEKLEAKKKECQTCENCYGEPVMGASGEGWDCIVDIQCKDASDQFGDNPGIGAGIAKTAGNVVEAIGNFFKGIFGGNENGKEAETSIESQESVVENAGVINNP